MTTPDVSVLLVSWNTRDLTLACLDSLPASVNDGSTYEVIVVDNGSRDGSAERLAEREDVRLVRNKANLGYAAAVNQAYHCARAELVLLLNSDVRLAPGALSALARFLREHPEVAGVAPAYRYPDGTPQAHHYRLPTIATALGIVTGLRRLAPLARRLRAYRMLDDDFSRPLPVPQPSASCLLLRRSYLPEGTLLDERFPIFFNDVVLARSLAEAGRELWMTPAAIVFHELGASTRKLGSLLARQHLASLTRYLTDTEPHARVTLFRLLVLADATLRRLLHRQGMSLGDVVRALRAESGPLPDGDTREWIVYASGIRWDWYQNRQQELARQLAATRRVLFLEPQTVRPSWRLVVEQLSESLWRARPPAPLPLGRYLPFANTLNRAFAGFRLRHWLSPQPGGRTLWIDEDLAAPLAGRLEENRRVYDAADLDWTFTRRWNRRHLRRALAAAVSRADFVLLSSRALARQLPAAEARTSELLNACDPEHFHPEGTVAPALARIPGPRLGYVGALDERAFDAPLVAAVARLRPDWSLVLVGPAGEAAGRALDGLPNVYQLGAVPYNELPALLRGFDVCLVPYRTEGRASYVHPKKLYEYLAVGKPVVATPLPALRTLDAPHRVAATPESFVAAVETALTETSPAHVRERRAAASANSWDARGRELRKLLDETERNAAC